MTSVLHIVVFYADAGGGHRATAEALREILEATGRFRVTLLNPYRELIPHLDLMTRLTGHSGEDFYNNVVLRKGRTELLCWLFYLLLKINYIACGPRTVRLVTEEFDRLRPDIALSAMPMANDVIVQALARHRSGLSGQSADPQAVVLMTDWSELSRGVWLPRQGVYHAICGTAESRAQARRVPALDATRVHPLTGLLIRPEFVAAAVRPAPAETLGLDPDRPVVTVLYGAQGSDRMLALARTLIHVPHTAQIVFLCGRNAALAAALRAEDFPYSAQIVEFTDRVPDYLACSDLFVGKPGPGSVSEALALGLPVLLDRRMALPQEMAILKHVQRQGLGQAFSSMKEFRRGFTRHLAAHPPDHACETPPPNRSTEEIAGILAAIHAGHPPKPGATA